MSLTGLTNDTVDKISEALDVTLSEEQNKKLFRIVENALIESVRKTTQSCSNEAVLCCGPDADMAHQISQSMKKARNAVIANLMSSP